MEAKRNVRKFIAGKVKRKGTLGRTRRKREGGLKQILDKHGAGVWTGLARFGTGTDRWAGTTWSVQLVR